MKRIIAGEIMLKQVKSTIRKTKRLPTVKLRTKFDLRVSGRGNYQMRMKKYRDLYKVELVESNVRVKQKVVYTGDYYKLDMPKKQEYKYKISLISIPAIMAVLFICMGLLNNDGSRIFYIVMPYTLQFLPIAYMIISAVSFYPKDVLTAVQYEKTYIRIRTAATWMLILSCASILGEIIFILRGVGSTFKMELIFLFCNIIIAVLAIIILQIHGRITFRTVQNDKNP